MSIPGVFPPVTCRASGEFEPVLVGLNPVGKAANLPEKPHLAALGARPATPVWTQRRTMPSVSAKKGTGMRILITNDDGISAPGLKIAEAIAAELAGPKGEIWVVAPAFEQSGVSHCISYVRPMRLEHLEERRHAVEGSPADCVLAAMFEILKDNPPDLILSGVNRGHNVAEDVLYSGTVGGAMEGALLGVKSIAMSQYFGPGNRNAAKPFAAAAEHGAAICRKLVERANWQSGPWPVFYNINFPPCAPGAVKGVRPAVQGRRNGPSHNVQPQTSPNGRRYLWLSGGIGNEHTEPGSDARETMEGWITVTPLQADLTAHNEREGLAHALR
jgi:5'-nucleotidase